MFETLSRRQTLYCQVVCADPNGHRRQSSAVETPARCPRAPQHHFWVTLCPVQLKASNTAPSTAFRTLFATALMPPSKAHTMSSSLPNSLMLFAVKQNPTSTLISSGFVTSSHVPGPTVDRLVSTNSGAASVDATTMSLDWRVMTENEGKRCVFKCCDLSCPAICKSERSPSVVAHLEVTTCKDNASALNADAHTDKHLELVV